MITGKFKLPINKVLAGCSLEGSDYFAPATGHSRQTTGVFLRFTPVPALNTLQLAHIASFTSMICRVPRPCSCAVSQKGPAVLGLSRMSVQGA